MNTSTTAMTYKRSISEGHEHAPKRRRLSSLDGSSKLTEAASISKENNLKPTSRHRSLKKKKKNNHKTHENPKQYSIIGGNIKDPLNISLEEPAKGNIVDRVENVNTPPPCAVRNQVGIRNPRDPLDLKRMFQQHDNDNAIDACDSTRNDDCIDEHVDHQKELQTHPENINYFKRPLDVPLNIASSKVDSIMPGREDPASTSRTIVSPVVPVKHWGLPSRPRVLITPNLKVRHSRPVKDISYAKSKNKFFAFGNQRFDHHVRMPIWNALQPYKGSLFDNKDVLDIGCNWAYMCFAAVVQTEAKSVVGIDIDKHLVRTAKKHIEGIKTFQKKRVEAGEASCRAKPGPNGDKSSGEINATSFYDVGENSVSDHATMKQKHVEKKDTTSSEEDNTIDDPIYDKRVLEAYLSGRLKVVHENYVPPPPTASSKDTSSSSPGKYDTIICLGVTKWVQLNFGDSGLQRFFKRVFSELRAGGVLVLEAQSYTSYRKDSIRLERHAFENLEKMLLYPHRINSYLLHEIGFYQCKHLWTYQRNKYHRTVNMFTKPMSPKK